MTIEDYNHIEMYLKGELKGEHLDRFQLKYDSNPSFRNEVELQRLVHESIVEANLQVLKTKMSLMDVDELIQTKNARKSLKWIIGGLLALSVSSGVAWYSFNGSIDTEKIETEQLVNEQKESSTDELLESVSSEKTKTNIHSIQSVKDALKMEVDPSSGEKVIKDHKLLNRDVHYVKRPSIKNAVAASGFESNLEKPVYSFKPEICLETQANNIFKQITPSCYLQSTGSIELSAEPSSIIINNGELVNDNLRNMSAGEYHLSIKVDERCPSIESKVVIQERYCIPDQSIASAQGEKWEAPTFNMAGNLKVYDRNGDELFTTSFSENEKVIWNGNDARGNRVSAGVYFFQVNFKKGEPLTGEITVLE